MGFGKNNSARRRELERAIEILEDARKKKQNFVGDLVAKYEAGEITEEEYKKLLDKVLEGASLSKWNKYYQDSISVYRSELNKERNKVNVARIVIPVFLFLLIGVFYFFFFSGFQDSEVSFSPLADVLLTESCDSLPGSWQYQDAWWTSWLYQSQNYCQATGQCNGDPLCESNGKWFNQTITGVSQYSELTLSQFSAMSNVGTQQVFGFEIWVDNGIQKVQVANFEGDGTQQQILTTGANLFPLSGLIDWTVSDQITIIYICKAGISNPGRFCVVDNVLLDGTLEGDVTPPVVTIVEPTARIYSNDESHPILIEATVTDDVDPPGSLVVEYSLDDGQTNFSMTNTGADTFEAEVSGLASNNYRVNVYAQDSSGNMNNAEFRDFSIDNTLIAGCGAVIDDPSEGYLYSLIQNINPGFADCVNVSQDDVLLNGQGFQITGSGTGRGINIVQDSVDRFNSTDITISGFSESIGDSNFTLALSGVNITLFNSNVEQVISPGKDSNGAPDAGYGGSVWLYNSDVSDTVDIRGGDVINPLPEAPPGKGGNLYVEGDFLDLSGLKVRVVGGETTVGKALPGYVLINYTEGFVDVNANYGLGLFLRIVNGSSNGGEIEWLNEIDLEGVIGFSSVGVNSRIGHNYSFVEPNPGGGIFLNKLNSPARVTFYDMTDGFSDPKIWKDDLECTDCTIIDPLNTVGDIRFEVSGFSAYRIGDEIISTNSPPVVESIQTIANQFITEGGTTDVTFEVTVSDPDGFADIQNVDAEFNGPLGTVRSDSVCDLVGNNGVDQGTFECVIGIEFYDEAGSWDVSATADDGEFQDTLTEPGWFNLAETLAVDIQGVNWITNVLSPGGQDIAADSQQTLTNLGNKDVIQITITGASLLGDTQGGSIDSNSFSVDLSSSCVDNLRLENGNAQLIVGASLPRGQSSQETLLYCAEQVPTGLPAEGYSGQWELLFSLILGFTTMFATALSVRKKKLSELLKGLSKEELFEVLGERILELKESEESIPVSIFRENMSPAEVLCKYLKENEGMKFSEIADLIQRDQRTVWNNYHHAIKKSKDKIKPEKGVDIPISILGNRKLSVLESVVYYLKNKGYKNLEIAKMLGKDSRNVWTLYSRAKKKLSK